MIYREGEEEEDEDEEKSKKRSWKRKRSKKFKEAVIKQKPVFNPDEGPFERYFDEYYKLDCEDVVGDVKCRFGYRKTEACSYGLTVDEYHSVFVSHLKHFFAWSSVDCCQITQIFKLAETLIGPRFTGRVNFPKNRKFTVFDPDIPGTPIYRGKSFPPSIPVNWGPTVLKLLLLAENLPAIPSSDVATEEPAASVTEKKKKKRKDVEVEGTTTAGDVVIKNSKKRKSAAGKGALSEARLAAYGLS
eukprot:sb/3468932/